MKHEKINFNSKKYSGFYEDCKQQEGSMRGPLRWYLKHG